MLLGAFTAVLGCTQPTTYFGTTKPRHPADELWINNSGEPEWIDPGKCSDSTGGEVINNLFAGLADAHPETLAPIPDVATHWDISHDGRTYTFHLRDTKWSDGMPVTAQDFEYAWKRVLDPNTASRYASMLHIIKNAQAYNEKATTQDNVGIHALDAHTLQVDLEDPVPYFLSLVAYHTFRPVPRHVIQKLEAQHINTDMWTRPEYIVSNGAYKLTSWHFKHYFTYEKNPYYWDAAHVRIARVKIFEVESANTALNLYRDGDLDWSGANTPLPSEFLGDLARYRDVHRDAMLSVYFYWLNTQEAPLDNVLLRRALSLAIDRDAVVRYIARGGQVPTAELVPDGLAGYHALHRPIFDPNKARELLAKSGYKPGDKPISLIYNTSEAHKQIAEAVQEMWRRNLGIDVQIENQEWKVFLKNAELRNFNIARMGWSGDYADPTTFLHDVLSSHAGNNHSGWADPNYEALLTRASHTQDKDMRLALLNHAEALAMEAQPIIPMYVGTHNYVRKPYLRGFWPNYQDRHAIKWMWIDPRYYDGTEYPELLELAPRPN